MAGRIYLLDRKASLVAMEDTAYDSEKLLQELLANYPDLLAGEQINSDDPRRWLLVMREMSIPGEEEGRARWSLDHLFIDQDGVPTLVEVKRSTDTRIRREVVGQMLDYAANAVAYWPVEEIRAKFESRCESVGEDPDELLSQFLREEQDNETFWQRVKTNLQAKRLRMVFLADTIPAELRRVVEFLNEQMDPAEVIAIEVKQFVGDGMKALVPRVLGQTETARQKKVSGTSSRDKISEGDFLSQLEVDRDSAELDVVRQLISWGREQGLADNFRQGSRGSAYIPILSHANRFFYPVSVQRRGMIVIQMRWLREHPPFDDPSKRADLLNRLAAIPGLRLTESGVDGFPKFPVASLGNVDEYNRFIETLQWIVTEIRGTD
ncbi:MAG: hypothetical protein JNL18_18035 [Planctomycetaceae bacterium]|nr:hypothetical protein [Planctomycetaceae bacterium]